MKIIYSLLFFSLLIYPNKLFEGIYLNYILIYVVFFIQQISLRVKGLDNYTSYNYTNYFFVSIFFVVLLGSLFSIIYTSHIGSEISLLSYFKVVFRYLSYLLLLFIFNNATKDKDDFKFIMRICIVAYTLSLIVITLDSFRLEFVDNIFKPESKLWLPEIHFRAYGAYLSPISAGIFIMNTLVILVAVLFEGGKRSKEHTFLLGVLLLLSVYCLLVTASRTAIGGVFILFILTLYNSKRKVLFLLIGIVITFILVQSGLLDIYIDNIISRNHNQSTHTNIFEGSGRYDTYLHSFRLFFDVRTLFFGVSPAEYALGDGVYSLAHNGFLSILLCYGVIGLIVFVTYFGLLLIKERNNHFNYILITRFIIVNSITFISSDGPVTHFWFIFLLFFSYFIIHNKIDGSALPFAKVNEYKLDI